MTNLQRLAVVVTFINLVLLVVLLGQVPTSSAQTDVPMLRGRGLELIDASGRIRAQFNVEPNGEAVFRMRDASGTIRVKLGASGNGSALLLIDETTEPGVQIIARRSATSTGSTTTSINLTGAGGKRRSITP